MGKHFLINPNKSESLQTDMLAIEMHSIEILDKSVSQQEKIAEQVMKEEDTLKHIEGRIIVKIDMEGKNYHRFENGTNIRRERKFNNLNFRETSPVNGIVVSAEGIPTGVEILVDYHSVHDSNKILNYKNKSKRVNYYSIKKEDCYLWNDGTGWKPHHPYELALRVFKKYDGVISWMKPEVMPNILYVTTGELKDKIVLTLLGCDYECVFQDTNGREGNRIRFLPFGEPRLNKEEEAICIREDLMKELKEEKLLIGYTLSDCKTLKEYKNA